MSASDHEDFHLQEDDEPFTNHEMNDDELVRYLDRMTADPISFFDHYLNERHGTWAAPRVRYELANQGWRISDRWAPATTRESVFILSDVASAGGSRVGGQLGLDHPRADSSTSWVHDPHNPVPYLVESDWGQCAGLPDEQQIHDRPDVLTFTTEPFERAADVAGNVRANLQVTTNAPAGHVIARLLDVYPSGRCRVIVEGASHVAGGNVATSVDIDLGDTAYRVRPGHALRLAISSSCFPLYPVHPGTDGDLWRDGVALAQANFTLHSSPGATSSLRLPLLEPASDLLIGT